MYAMVCMTVDCSLLLKRNIDYYNNIGMGITSNNRVQTNRLF